MANVDVGLVACSRRKAERPLPARELYVSPLFRAARAYAERRYGPERWYILSARHDLVHPDQVLAPYDLSLRQLTAAEREAWGYRVAVDLTHRFPAGTVLWFHACRRALPHRNRGRGRPSSACTAGWPRHRPAARLVPPPACLTGRLVADAYRRGSR
jgi:hypothetical protein